MTRRRRRNHAPAFKEKVARAALKGEDTLGLLGQDAEMVQALDVTERTRWEVALREGEERLRIALDAAGLGTFDWDMASDRITWSDGDARLWGFAADEFDGTYATLRERIHPDDLRDVETKVKESRIEQKPFAHEFRIFLPDGSVRWLTGRGELKWNQDGHAYRMIGVVQDITSRKEAEREKAEHTEYLQTILDNVVNGIVTINTGGTIESFNKSANRLFGYTSEEVIGRNIAMLMPEPHRSHHQSYIERYLTTGTARIIGTDREVEGRHKDGSTFPMNLAVSRITHNGVTHFVGLIRDVTFQRQAETEIRQLAFYDPLTQLPNRSLLKTRLQQAIKESGRSGRPGALLFVDLDNFKTLNDSRGHDTGDQLLQQIARRLTHCLREGDTVARFGGDEFVVVVGELGSDPGSAAEKAQAIGKKIQSALVRPYRIGRDIFHSTPSIGIAPFDGVENNSVDEVLKRGDLAMYEAKARGRNCLQFFDPAMQALVAKRANLEADLRQALVNGQLELHFQPQVDVDGRLIGAEALIRWPHPVDGMIPPAQFIPLAEDTGLILPLGTWVMEEACRHLADWERALDGKAFQLCVNVSTHQFHQPEFVTRVREILARTGADPNRLVLEITEGLLLQIDADDVVRTLQSLKADGVGFAIDDFGTGYSSLRYLKHLPLDTLKIDHSFVRDVTSDESDAAIVQTVIRLGESLGFTVLAEGVETLEQRTWLIAHGCQQFQGYLFGWPVPATEFRKVIGTFFNTP
ncbi:MAG: EAL domain-containing protein [Ectothiorhodospiraceae bacterium]|nr:EAL domain-containing protein [Ectothiorhodospiraceae bacterium]